MNYVCVDFDGTIVDHCYPDIGRPVPYTIETLKELQSNGIKIVLFTMRSDDQETNRDVLTQAVDYLKGNGIKLYGINKNPDQDDWTSSPKAYGNIYIDDAAYGCTLIHPNTFTRPCVNWSNIGKYVLEKLKNKNT